MLKTPNLSKYDGGSFYAFFLGTLEILERSNEPTILPHLAPLKNTVEKLEAGLRLDRNNALTAVIAAADKRRDNAFMGIKKNVLSYELHYKAEMREAAAVLMRNFKKYGNLTNLPYNEETGLLRALLRDWEDSAIVAAITTLGLTAWHEELKDAQAKFESVYIDRAESEGTKTVLPVYKLRPEATKVYNNLATLINAFAQLNIEAYVPILGVLNDQTQRFNEAVTKAEEEGEKKASTETAL